MWSLECGGCQILLPSFAMGIIYDHVTMVSVVMEMGRNFWNLRPTGFKHMFSTYKNYIEFWRILDFISSDMMLSRFAYTSYAHTTGSSASGKITAGTGPCNILCCGCSANECGAWESNYVSRNAKDGKETKNIWVCLPRFQRKSSIFFHYLAIFGAAYVIFSHTHIYIYIYTYIHTHFTFLRWRL